MAAARCANDHSMLVLRSERFSGLFACSGAFSGLERLSSGIGVPGVIKRAGAMAQMIWESSCWEIGP